MSPSFSLSPSTTPHHSHSHSLALLARLAVVCFALLLQCGLLSAQPTSLSDIVVTSVTGCTDTFPITVNCPIPVNISIHTAGVGELFVLGSQWLRLSSIAGGNYVYVQPDPTDPTNTTLWATVEPAAYSTYWTNTLVNISFYTWDGSVAPSFPAFTFVAQQAPVISSISGCTGSGLSTLNCAPDSSVLTIQGTGMGWLESMQLLIGTNQVYLYSAYTAINNTYGTLSLSTIYYGLLLPEHYNGVLLPLQFQSTAWLFNGTLLVETTNTVSISFVPLPAPFLVSARVSYFCDAVSSGLANYTGCAPGASQIALLGHYMYNLSATIGGVPCSTFYSDADSYYCFPTVAAGLQPNVAYSLVASNGQGSVSVGSFIAFTAKPTIAYVKKCTATTSYYIISSDYGTSAALCRSGTTITIKGSQFPLSDSTTQVMFTVDPWWGGDVGPFNFTCLGATVVDSSTVTCVLPQINDTLADSVYRRYIDVQLSFSSSSVWTNAITTQLFQHPLAPVISGLSASGCGPTTTAAYYPGGPLQVSDCVSNATLTLTGTYLNASYYTVRGSTPTPIYVQNAFLSAAILSNSSTQIVLQLPDMNNVPSPILTNTPYQYQLTMVNGATYFQTNIFLVTFAAPPPISPPSSSSSSGLSHGAIAGIVVAAVVVAAVCSVLVVLLLRRASSSSSSSSSSGRSTAAGGDDGLKWSEKPTRLRDDNNSGGEVLRSVELQ